MIRTALLIVPLMAALASAAAPAVSPPASDDVVGDVRAALAEGGLTRGEQTLGDYRSTHGTTPEALEALCWLARGALAHKLYDKALRYAEEAHTTAATAIRTNPAQPDAQLLNVVASGMEVAALALVERGGRSEAVYLLRNALNDYNGTPIARRLEDTLALVTMEGHAAPAIDPGVAIGPRLARGTASKPLQLIFFWAHWCQDCKSESATLARIAEKYRGRLEIVAPTRRYGYVDAGRPADPAKELRHIIAVRDSHYRFLKDAPVPVTDANYKTYGAAAVPLHVLVDRDGIVRLYRPGRMTEAELETAVDRAMAQ